jgi:DNA-binding transcriptional LysR family regulator
MRSSQRSANSPSERQRRPAGFNGPWRRQLRHNTFLYALSTALGGDARISHVIELGSTSTIVATARAGGGVAVVSGRAVAAELADGRLTELVVADVDLGDPCARSGGAGGHLVCPRNWSRSRGSEGQAMMASVVV